jgi:hypothetical protein
MYFPRYWAKASVDGPGRLGETVNVVAWGWSDISDADALTKANARAQAALPKIPPEQPRRGRGGQAAYYEDRPFREPILEDHSHGASKALITRNSFGCEVLNTDGVAFADIDHEPPRIGLFGALFGGGKKKAAEAQIAWENQTLEKLREWQRDNSSWSFRVYRTAGGLRLLRTSGLLAANGPEAIGWLEAVGSDPLYVRLCRNQKSFRARLTPKPWRCGFRQLGIRFPWAEHAEQKELESWLRKYQEKCAAFAVCDFIETIGNDWPAPDVAGILELHDARTSVGGGRPLA